MHMTTEIIKIIEGGLDKNRDKVHSYASLLADKLEADGELKFAERIKNLLEKKKVHPVYMDEFLSKPIDQESHLDMVEVVMPELIQTEIYLDELTSSKVENYINFLNNRDKFISKGIHLPESLLLYGPPGCGKTSIAYHIAKAANLPLIIARLDGLISSLLGSTAKNIRKIFDYAKERPCILFLDEFDAIAKARNDEQEIGELKRVVNSLLQNIDDFNKDSILIAATNHEKLLDPAIWRRFTNVIEVPIPQEETISVLVSNFLKDMPSDFLIDEKKKNSISKALSGLSPADIKTICYKTLKYILISDDEELNTASILYQIYLQRGFKESEVSIVSYLTEYGATQNEISKVLGISMRQVRNLIQKDGVAYGKR